MKTLQYTGLSGSPARSAHWRSISVLSTEASVTAPSASETSLLVVLSPQATMINIPNANIKTNMTRERKYKCNISSIYNTWFRVIHVLIRYYRAWRCTDLDNMIICPCGMPRLRSDLPVHVFATVIKRTFTASIIIDNTIYHYARANIPSD